MKDTSCISIDNLPLNNTTVLRPSRGYHRVRAKSVPDPVTTSSYQIHNKTTHKHRWPVASYYYTSSFPSLYNSLYTNGTDRDEPSTTKGVSYPKSRKSCTPASTRGSPVAPVSTRGVPAATLIGDYKERFPWRQCSRTSFTSVKVLTPRQEKDSSKTKQPNGKELESQQITTRSAGDIETTSRLPSSGTTQRTRTRSNRSGSCDLNQTNQQFDETISSIGSHSPVAIPLWSQRRRTLSSGSRNYVTRSMTSLQPKKSPNARILVNTKHEAQTLPPKSPLKPANYRLSFAQSYTAQLTDINQHKHNSEIRKAARTTPNKPILKCESFVKQKSSTKDQQTETNLNDDSREPNSRETNSNITNHQQSVTTSPTTPSVTRLNAKSPDAQTKPHKPVRTEKGLAYSAAHFRDRFDPTSKSSLLSSDQLVIRESVEKVQRWMRTLPKHFHTIHHVLPPVQHDY